MLNAAPQLDRIFSTCSESTLTAKVTELVRLSSHLASRNCVETLIRPALENAFKAGASENEVLCAACLGACVGGPAAEAAFVEARRTQSAKSGHETASARPFARVQTEALDERTRHLVGLAACLVTGCECAAGHIVEARQAGANNEELARAACLAACASGLTAKWRFVAALQCAEQHELCAC